MTELRARIPAQSFALHLLGSPVEHSEASLSGSRPPAGRRVALLAPPLRAALTRERLISAVVVVSARQVFDLEDWVCYPGLDRLILVRVGDTPLQQRMVVAELEPAQQDELAALLRADPEPPSPREQLWAWAGSSSLRYGVDRCGFPLVYVEPSGIWVHLFPIAWPQLECFLAEADQPGLDNAWYAGLQQNHARASAHRPNGSEYEHLLATGFSRGEAEALAAWLGQGYRLLSSEEWYTTARWLAEQPAEHAPVALDGRLSYAARDVWNVLYRTLAPTNGGRLALMDRGCGILEWVADPLPRPPRSYGGSVGQPRPGFYKHLRTGNRAYDVLQERSRVQGVRLCTINI